MITRRADPLSDGSGNGNGNGSGSGSGQQLYGSIGGGARGRCKSIKSVLFFCCFVGLYFYINAKEKTASMWASSTPQELPKVRLDGTATYDFVLKPENEFTPAIVWLMSFPNSGTSYTMTMVAKSSDRAFATNYCDEVTSDTDEESLSIYPRRPEGPCWAGKSGKVVTPRDLPEKFVLTKTHCGSRCVRCGPDEYIETPAVFLKRCASGHTRVAPKRRRVQVEYPPERVAKAIHLIRNPFHNIIARYHLEHRHAGYDKKTNWLEGHPNDKTGLQKYCSDTNERYKEQDEAFFGKGNIPKAPCHGEFYKWTQWHNLARDGLELIESLHEMPVLTVHYEDYARNFNSTVDRILDFLELEHTGSLHEFSARSDYGGYFTEKEEQEVRALVKRVAHKKTWEQVKHYFDEE